MCGDYAKHYFPKKSETETTKNGDWDDFSGLMHIS